MIVERGEFSRFIDTLLELKYQVIEPTVREGAIVYEELGSPTGTSRSDGPMIRTAGSTGLKKKGPGPFWFYHGQYFIEKISSKIVNCEPMAREILNDLKANIPAG